MQTKPEIREAAVIVPLFRSPEGELKMVLVRRGPGGVHGGQIAFPGGKREPGDRSLIDSALRELMEEIAVPAAEVEILESLPPMQTLTTQIQVFPFLGKLLNPGHWKSAEHEIDEIIEMPVAWFAKPEAHDYGMESFHAWPEPRRVPFYRIGPHRAWGLTYRILEPLIPRLLAGQWMV
jgi:8-oxo-dGTP pyrophosphatase MutT (NUDIX family)